MGDWDWVKYTPVLSNIQGAATGDWAQALTGPAAPLVRGGKKYFFDDPANEVKDAYDKAASQSQASQQKYQQFMDQRRAEALGFYSPLQKLFQGAYGTNGLQGPQVPQAPGGTLASLYGGAGRG
jgi:hypothetical protein